MYTVSNSCQKFNIQKENLIDVFLILKTKENINNEKFASNFVQ